MASRVQIDLRELKLVLNAIFDRIQLVSQRHIVRLVELGTDRRRRLEIGPWLLVDDFNGRRDDALRLVAGGLAAGLALRHLPDPKIAIREIRLIDTSLKIVTDAASRVRLMDRYVIHLI